MIKNLVQSSLMVCLTIFWFVYPLEGAHKQKITGRVIARDPYMGLAHTSSATNLELFIVKVDKAQGATRFIKVRYEDYADQYPLPAELLEGKSHWTFSLSRNKNCDQVVLEGLFVRSSNPNTPPNPGTFVLVKDAGEDLPPIKSRISCFVLRPDGVKPTH